MSTPKGGYTSSLDKFLDTLKSRPVEASIELLVSLLKRRQIKGSEACATATAHILLQVVARDKWINVDQLLYRIQLLGKKLVAAQPHELVIGNIVRRVLGLIRDEATEDRKDDATTDSPRPTSPPPAAPAPSVTAPPSHASSPAKPVRPGTLGNTSLGSLARTQSMFNLLSDPNVVALMGSNASTPGQLSGASTPILNAQTTSTSALRSEVIDGIQEIMDEIKMVDEQVQAYAEIYIHPGDYILVYQPSRTVQKFLTRAAAKRKFTVFLAIDPSSATTSEEQYASLHKSMASYGSSIITVLNAGLNAYMPRVNKVILGARAITAQGGVVVDSGAATIARAARERRREVIVLGGVYKLSPESRLMPESQVAWSEPSRHVNFANGPILSNVKVKSAISEFLPAAYVDTYVTNLGALAQDNLHALIADHYKEEDIDFALYGKAQR
ncbi:initiation factor 2 subunit family protein [Astrocystis sublimbata]|nr:initiation factor 2 subunit family protein [Astrocystis sublimbata]